MVENRLTSILLIGAEKLLNLVTNFTIRNLDIILGLAVIGHKGEESIVGDIELSNLGWNHTKSIFHTYKLIFLTGDIGDVHIVGRWAKIFELLASEDIDGNEMNLGVTMLARLRGAHFDNLAGARLDHDEAVLAERRALHRISGRSASIGALESVPRPVLEQAWK